MFLHIGKNKTVSTNEVVAILNVETILKSEYNENYKKNINEELKTIIVLQDDSILKSEISPYTLISRDSLSRKEIMWSKNNG